MTRCELYIWVEGLKTYQGIFEDKRIAEMFAKSLGYPYETKNVT